MCRKRRSQKDVVMMSIRAVIVDHDKASHVTLGRVEAPVAQPSETIVQVAAISLNPGELLGAASREQGSPIGWDLAGTVIQQAADGSGPPTGSRVVGLIVTGGWGDEAPGLGAWAEQVAVPTTQLALLPDTVSFAQAATVPIAGLTALRALEKGGMLWKQRVLITGATGGVGDFAVQLAHRAGACVVGTTRTAQREALVRANGANEVCIGNTIANAQQFGPYHLILDSIGGQALAEALSMLTPDGLCVNIGVAATQEVTFSPVGLLQAGGTGFYALALFHEFRHRPAAPDLARLGQALADGDLHPHIEVERSLEEIEDVVQQLMSRAFTGKAVLRVH